MAQAASYYARYTHGSAGTAASSQPAVSIGYFDDIGGVPSFPDNKVAANAAVQFVNNNLGGVAGHPIKLVDCFVATTEQQGQACAQQFLAQKVKVVVEGTALLGAQALHSALNGTIPVVVSRSRQPSGRDGQELLLPHRRRFRHDPVLRFRGYGRVQGQDRVAAVPVR